LSTLQSSGSADSSPDASYLNEQTDSDAGRSLEVHTRGTHCTSVDVFHAYCALAVVRHRHTDWQCALSCCSDELTAHKVAGLCRLLLWDVDMCQRRCAEELMYIHQLQTGLSAGSCNSDPLSTVTNQPSCRQSSHPGDEFNSSSISDVNQVDDKSLMSQHEEHESTQTRPCVSQRDTTAVDSVQVNTVSDVQTSSADLQPCGEWQTLPVDVKYSQRQLSGELLQQEANRLHHLCDGISHCVVITFHKYCFY